MNVDGSNYQNLNLEKDIENEKDRSSKKEKSSVSVISELAKGFLYACIGYLLGVLELPFGASPFAMAFLCAANRRVPYIFAGACLSAFMTDKPIVFICAYIVALTVRVLTRVTLDRPQFTGEDEEEKSFGELWRELFCENIFLRMATACVGGFVIGIYTLIEGGFLYYDLYGSIILMLAAPTAVLLSMGLFGSRVPKEGAFYFFSSALIAFGSSYAAKNLHVFGMSAAAFGVMFATLYFCRKKGIVFGIAAALVCGIGYSPLLAPAFIFAALFSGALWRVSSLFASVCAFSASMAWGFYIDGIGAITGLMPALLAAALLFGVLDKIFFNANAGTTVKKEEKAAAAESVCCGVNTDLSKERFDAVQTKMKTLCETFSSMSHFFYELSGRMKRPLAGDIKQICDRAFDACCGNCKHKTHCWETHYSDTISYVASISAAVHKEGKVGMENIPVPMREICDRLPDITDEINYNSSLHAKQLLLCDKTEIFALDYEAISDLLASSMRVDDSDFECYPELAEKLAERFSECGFKIDSVSVFGKRKKKILLSAKDETVFKENEDSIYKIAEEVCAAAFDRTGLISHVRENVFTMTISQKRRISVKVAKKSFMSGGESEFCGDTVTVFENAVSDKYFSLISDGMGSGREAALTSGICAMFLQKMLMVSNRCSAALKMLNGFLRNKGGGSMHECSATVDLLEIDLILGKAAFYKSGAAPSYVFREGSLFKLRSKTVPVGIIKELDAKKLSFDVGHGDVIVMVSDGVTQGKEECPWLFELLKKNIEGEGIERTAELIAERARRENGNDDISVVIIGIE